MNDICPTSYGKCNRPLPGGKQLTCGGDLILKEVPTDWRKATYVCDKCGEVLQPWVLGDIFSVGRSR